MSKQDNIMQNLDTIETCVEKMDRRNRICTFAMYMALSLTFVNLIISICHV